MVDEGFKEAGSKITLQLLKVVKAGSTADTLKLFFC